MSDALAVAVWLNVFIRQSKYMGMANIAQSVNVISPLMTTKDGIVKQTTWWPLLLFSKYMRGHTLATHVGCEMYEGETGEYVDESFIASIALMQYSAGSETVCLLTFRALSDID